MFNNDKYRKDNIAKENTISVWTGIYRNYVHLWIYIICLILLKKIVNKFRLLEYYIME